MQMRALKRTGETRTGETHKSESAFAGASGGSSQHQRQQQRLLPLLSTAQAMLSVKAPGHKSALEPRNHCLCSFCSLEESSWWSSSFNEQQGVHSSALGARSGCRKDQELNLASQQPGKRSGFRKVTCGPVYLVFPATVLHQTIFPTFSPLSGFFSFPHPSFP